MCVVTKDHNPFLEIIDEKTEKLCRDNQDSLEELRTWALENLETLNAEIATNETNDILENPIKEDPSSIKTCKLT